MHLIPGEISSSVKQGARAAPALLHKLNSGDTGKRNERDPTRDSFPFVEAARLPRPRWNAFRLRAKTPIAHIAFVGRDAFHGNLGKNHTSRYQLRRSCWNHPCESIVFVSKDLCRKRGGNAGKYKNVVPKRIALKCNRAPRDVGLPFHVRHRTSDRNTTDERRPLVHFSREEG